jgi:hypothetical protein
MMDISKIQFNSLTPGEEFIIKWQFRLLGDFKTALITAITRADGRNLERLALGFPDEVEGYSNYIQTPGWWADIKKKANIDWWD